ncbi:hypothetical protein GYMLUDRAFT_44679 [Collybiopsis luxurians FD-317 M1]|uniref:Uncharacterized protein n=1 Tax=Collybiopsis luxurians FD-317 M1 TaxID=944289 RepID=A0A0D0B764_9AGAR|nr:hypothetical protein GYMLUDRAFT_44679 [Collybiopsis luxurians FD-317 M1]
MSTVPPSAELKHLSKKHFCNTLGHEKVERPVTLRSLSSRQVFLYRIPEKSLEGPKPFCKKPEDMRRETEDESWNIVYQEYGHKKMNVLTPVTESLEQQFV